MPAGSVLAYLFAGRTALLINHYQQLLRCALFRLSHQSGAPVSPVCVYLCACEFIFRLKKTRSVVGVTHQENKPQYNHSSSCCCSNSCCKLLGALNCRSFPLLRPTYSVVVCYIVFIGVKLRRTVVDKQMHAQNGKYLCQLFVCMCAVYKRISFTSLNATICSEVD